jgi:antitoxin (DNA-binding transcriptional repressor) of toxin-antitoxin stability system
MRCNIVYINATGANMAMTASDVISLSQARATLSELADQVKAGAEKIITKNGESYVASRGLADVAPSHVKDARSTLAAVKRRRSAKAAG